MSGYDEIGAGCFADGYIAAGGTRDKELCALLMEEFKLDKKTAQWHIAEAWKRSAEKIEKQMQAHKYVMENEKYMYLPTLTEDEFVGNIESKNFFRCFGNPAIIRTKAGKSIIVLSAELYDRMAELCGFPGTEEMIRNEPRT